MWLLIGLGIGVLAGVVLISLAHMARHPSEKGSECSGNCNQGRNCNCSEK